MTLTVATSRLTEALARAMEGDDSAEKNIDKVRRRRTWRRRRRVVVVVELQDSGSGGAGDDDDEDDDGCGGGRERQSDQSRAPVISL